MSLTPREKIKQVLDSYGDIYEVNTYGSNKPSTVHEILQRKLEPLSSQSKLDLEHLQKHGYVILKNVLNENEINKFNIEIEPLMSSTEYSNTKSGGKYTKRVRNHCLLKSVEPFFLNKRVKSLVDHTLMENYILSTSEVIRIYPRTEMQPLHYDQLFLNVGKKRIGFTRKENEYPLMINALYAIDDFTSENGATRLFPGSHKWNYKKIPNFNSDKWIEAIMKKGDCILFYGTVWHCGGENISNKSRTGLALLYCEPFLRPLQNYFLMHNPKDILKLHPQIQKYLGYSVHFPAIGFVDYLTPIKYIKNMSKL